MQRDALISYLTELFSVDTILQRAATVDSLANGVQIHGKTDVRTVIVGVSPTIEFFALAKQKHADFIITKHPLVFAPVTQTLDQSTQERLKYVFQNEWTMAGYHYALDVHPTIGNTPIILAKLGAEKRDPIMNTWGFSGVLERPRTLKEIAQEIEKITNHEAFIVHPQNAEKEKIHTIGVATGGAIPRQSDVVEFSQKGIQLYITGEISEWTVHLFRESNIAYIASGHHATEVFGPQALAQNLQKSFGRELCVEFVNVWNEI